MNEKFSAESANLDQSSANKNVSDGEPNQPTDIREGLDVGANLKNKNGAEISEKIPHLESHYTERSSSTGPDKSKTNLSSLADKATSPSTPTRLPWKSGENRHPSGPSPNLPISGLYAEFAQKTLPDELRIELHLAEGANYGDALAAVVFGAAIKGSIPATREIREAVEGKANQRSNPEAAKGFEVIVTYEQPPLLKMMSTDGPPQE